MILYCTKMMNELVDNPLNTFFSPTEYNAALGKAEKYFFQVRTTQVSGTSPTLTLLLETSNDGVLWSSRSTPINLQVIPSNNAGALFGQELGTSSVGGMYTRFGIKLGGTLTVAFVEVWVTGRTAV